MPDKQTRKQCTTGALLKVTKQNSNQIGKWLYNLQDTMLKRLGLRCQTEIKRHNNKSFR